MNLIYKIKNTNSILWNILQKYKFNKKYDYIR